MFQAYDDPPHGHRSEEDDMAIAAYFHPEQMTAAQYDEVIKRLEAVGSFPAPGLLHHSSFGDPEHLMVFDVWDSQESFDKFGQTLMPILSEMGLDAGQPMVMPVHNLLRL
jgi:hypothetical protein